MCFFVAKDRFGENTEIHRDFGRLCARAGRSFMMRQERQFSVAEVTDFEMIFDEHFGFGREGLKAKREQRR